MSNRGNEKRITKDSRTIKFLREQAKLSLKAAAPKSGVGWSVIAHLETGRIKVGDKHLEKLLPVYGVPLPTYRMFSEGTINLPVNLKAECLELVGSMTREQLLTALPVLRSLSAQGRYRIHYFQLRSF